MQITLPDGQTPTRRSAMGSAARRTLLLMALLPAALLTFVTSAAANPPIQIGIGSSSTPPSVAVDSAGTAYIVWTATSTSIAYCKLFAGASSCAATSTLTVGGGVGSTLTGNPQILFDGSTLVVLAEAVATSGGISEFNGVQEWTSTSPYEVFTPALGGKAVSYVGGEPRGAVVLPGSAPGNPLGFVSETTGSGPRFQPFTSEKGVSQGQDCLPLPRSILPMHWKREMPAALSPHSRARPIPVFSASLTRLVSQTPRAGNRAPRSLTTPARPPRAN